ncbi:MAG TPA: hypothetical protein VMZ31_01810 [Phycisphaerae bacterium]|nr:hypothetical protein [Phycisphaerae bacterium]
MYGRRSYIAFFAPMSMAVTLMMVSGVSARQQPALQVQPTATQRVSPPQQTSPTPLPGQVVVDADHPQWLKRHGGGPFFMCGPGDPEGFLYRGTRNPDGTRNGDQMALIEKLKGTGANCVYLMAVRSHGGDGDSTHNPFVDSDPTRGLDQDILNQWEAWFVEMANRGTGNLGDGESLPPGEPRRQHARDGTLMAG